MRKLRLVLAMLGCLALAGGMAACGGSQNNSSSGGNSQKDSESNSNSSEISSEETFLADLPEQGDYEIFSEISLETAAAVINETQVIDPESITVTFGENKEEVTVKDGVLLLEKVGKYTATFTFENPNGTTVTYTREFNSVDTTAPTIVGKFKNRYTQNKEIDLSKAMLIMDALDENPTTDVKVYKGEKKAENLVNITDGKFVATEIGIHTAVITATDDYSNTNTKEFSFRVADVHEFEAFNGDELLENVVVGLGGAQLAYETEASYVKEGASSLEYKHSGSSEAIGLKSSANIDWTQYTGMEFWVYNPSETYDYIFRLCAFTDFSGVYGTGNGENLSIKVECPKSEWTKVTVYSDMLYNMTKATESAPNGAPCLTLQILSSDNGWYLDLDGDGVRETPSEQWDDIELYFDDFRFLTETIISVEEHQNKYRVGEVATIPQFNVLACGAQSEYQVKVFKDGEDITPSDGNSFEIDEYADYYYEVTAPEGKGEKVRKFPIRVYADTEFEYFDYEDSFDEEVVSRGGANITFSTAYTKDGKGALRYRKAGTWTWFKFANSNEIDWTKEEGLSFWVYNPSEFYDYKFSVGGYVTLDTVLKDENGNPILDENGKEQNMNSLGNGNNAGLTFTALKNQWTRVVISSASLIKMTEVTDSALNGAPYIGIGINYTNNGSATDSNTAQWNAIDLYFDMFELKCELQDSFVGADGDTELFYVTHGETEIAGVTEKTLKIQTIKAYNYPNGVFTASDKIVWNGNKLTFKVYNPTAYPYLLNVRAFPLPSVYQNVGNMNSATISLTSSYISAGKTAEITIYGDTFDYTTYPYLALYMNAGSNGGSNSERMLACELYVYDMEISAGTSAELPTTEDYKWAVGYGLKESAAVINTDSAYCVKGSEYSLHFIPVANWPTAAISNSAAIDWSNVKSITLSIYNPTKYTHSVTLGLYTSETDSTLVANTKKEVYLSKRDWTTVTIDLSSVSGALGNVFFISTGHSSNGGSTSEQWQAFMTYGLYFDGFNVEYKA